MMRLGTLGIRGGGRGGLARDMRYPLHTLYAPSLLFSMLRGPVPKHTSTAP